MPFWLWNTARSTSSLWFLIFTNFLCTEFLSLVSRTNILNPDQGSSSPVLSQLAGIAAENCTLWRCCLAYFLFVWFCLFTCGGILWTEAKPAPGIFSFSSKHQEGIGSCLSGVRQKNINYPLFHLCFFRQKGVFHNLQSAEILVIHLKTFCIRLDS